MVQKLFDSYVFLYIMGIISAIGILIKLCLFWGYCSLIRASDAMSSAKKKWIKQMKEKFETCYQQKLGVNNVDTFVDKCVSKRKFCGILLSTWENISGQAVSLCLLTASCSGILGIVYDCGKDIVLFTFFAGAFVSVVVVIVDNVVNIAEHKKLLYLNLKDYFENDLKVRLEREHFYPEQLQQYQKEYFNSIDESKLQIAASKEGEVARINEENESKAAEQVIEAKVVEHLNKANTVEQATGFNVVDQNMKKSTIETSEGKEILVSNGNPKNELKKTEDRFQKGENKKFHKPSKFQGKNGNKHLKNNHENLLHNSKAERTDKFTGDEKRSESFAIEEKKSATALAKKEEKAARNAKKETRLSSKTERIAKKEAKKAAAIKKKENKKAARLAKQEAKKAAILKKKEDKRAAIIAAKEAKRAAKLAEFNKKEAAKKAKMEAVEQKKAEKKAKQEEKIALKAAVKKEKVDLINAKKDAVEKQKQEAIQAKLLKKEEQANKKVEQAKEKEEAKKQKEEKPSHQQRAYQLKMQLLQEKELELKIREEESRNKIEVPDVFENIDKEETAKIITLHNKIENGTVHNARFSESVNEKSLEKSATVNHITDIKAEKNFNFKEEKNLSLKEEKNLSLKEEKNLNLKEEKSLIQKSEEDKLIEEVLREFLA